MRTLLACTLLLASATAFAADLTFDQAQALASKDSASLNGDQMATAVASQSKASSVALDKCPKPVKKADFASFVIVMELDAAGKVTHTWLQGNTPAATCFNDVMSHQTYSKPPHAPFYSSFDMYWQQ